MDSDLWTAHSRDLVRYAAALIGPDDAEDAVSSVFLRVMERQGFDAIDEPRQYLFRAVLNDCRTRARKREQRITLTEHPRIEVPDDLYPEILDAVMALPIRQRAATFLVYWMGYSVEDSAELMGLAAGTVKRYLHLARRSLGRQLGAHILKGALYAD
jgi:RNA polymerase sigma-70 factor (ECF subfamily)